MVNKLNGRLVFAYGAAKSKNNGLIKANFRLSLLTVLIGIFLLPQAAYLASITPENLIDLTNRERSAQGLNALTANQLLAQAAILKAQMIIESQTFGHTINDKKFSSWVREAGYNYSYIGENLALDFTTSEGILEAWNNSAMHKKNLLSPYYTEIGIAAVKGNFKGEDTTVVVQIFGAPAASSVQLLADNSGINYINANIASEKLNSPSNENLLTNSILDQARLPSINEKLNLPNNNYSPNQMNKLFIQPNYLTLNNFIITFASMALSLFLMYLYFYYFLKIYKLASV